MSRCALGDTAVYVLPNASRNRCFAPPVQEHCEERLSGKNRAMSRTKTFAIFFAGTFQIHLAAGADLYQAGEVVAFFSMSDRTTERVNDGNSNEQQKAQ